MMDMITTKSNNHNSIVIKNSKTTKGEAIRIIQLFNLIISAI